MLEHWNTAIRLIESTLDTGVDVSELARTARTSEYHFRRVFSALAGMSLSEYIRRRRLTLATAEILDGDAVLDVAVRHGYGSGDAFTRAFKAMHGITPTQARQPGAVLSSQHTLVFHLTIEGAHILRHRVTDLPAFRIVGKKGRLPLRYQGENPALAEFHRSIPTGTDERLRGLADIDELPSILFVSANFEEGRDDGSLFDYYLSVATGQRADALPRDLDMLEVAASTWVVFDAESRDGRLAEALQQLWADSFGEWFPSNPYRVVPGPEILSITEASDEGASGTGELWLPVERD